MRRKRKYPITISEVLGKTASKLNLDKRLPIYRLEKVWDSLVGSPISNHSHPMKLRGRTLILYVDHPSLMQELSYLKPQLLQKIRKVIPVTLIDDIKFRLGDLPQKLSDNSSKTAPNKRTDLTDEEKEFIELAAEQIHDEGIRAAAKRVMEKGFRNKKPKSMS